MSDRVTDWFPLDPAAHLRQLGAILALLDRLPRDLCGSACLDIGCGDGRIAAPVARAGIRVIGVDNDPAAVAACASLGLVVRRAEALDPCGGAIDPPGPGESFGAAWCLGHTFMLFHDVERAAALLRRLRAAIAPGGWFAIDSFCAQLWDDVSEGLWQTGVSEDGRWQLIWTPGGGDNTVVIRRGGEVDPRDWTPRADEARLRLWSLGELALLAAASGWRGPHAEGAGALLVFS